MGDLTISRGGSDGFLQWAIEERHFYLGTIRPFRQRMEGSSAAIRRMTRQLTIKKNVYPYHDPRIIEFDVRTDEMLLVNMAFAASGARMAQALVLRTDAKSSRSVIPHIGYLHRAKAEKIGENLTPRQWIQNTDRMDYVDRNLHESRLGADG